MTQTYYHGTTSKALPSILKEGLIPAARLGSDALATIAGMHFPQRAPSVYLNRDASYVAHYADLVSSVIGGKPAYLKVELPATVARKLKQDEADETDSFRCESPILPKYITAYRIGDSGQWTPTHQSA